MDKLANSVFTFRRVRSNERFLGPDSPLKEVLSGSSDLDLLNHSNLALLYEFSRPAEGNVVHYYSLNKYSPYLDTDLDDSELDFTGDFEEVAEFIRNYPSFSMSGIDILNREYTKNLYRYLILINRNRS